MFEQKGLVTIDLSATKRDPDELQLMAIDAGADDVVVDDETLEVYCDWTQLNAVRQAFLDQGVPVSNAEKIMRAKTLIQPDEKDALAALRLIEKLEDLDDVQKVYSNLDITAELVARFDS